MKEKIIWTLKTVIIFFVLYGLSAVIGEVIVIAGFTIAGFDPLHGDLPDTYFVGLVPLYGMAVFLLLTLLYVKLIAKRKLTDIRLSLSAKFLPQTLAGLLAGGLATILVILVLTMTGDYRFLGYNGLTPMPALITLVAFIIQSSAEEVMCRGFLQNFLEEKIPRGAAIFVTGLAFMAPHLGSMDNGILIGILSICNLMLVSILFSLLMLRWNSLWVPIGFHIGWNYILSYVMGLQLSGMDSSDAIFLFETASGRTWLHGGNYGIEAGLLTTILLLVIDGAIYFTGKEKLKQ